MGEIFSFLGELFEAIYLYPSDAVPKKITIIIMFFTSLLGFWFSYLVYNNAINTDQKSLFLVPIVIVGLIIFYWAELIYNYYQFKKK